MSNNIIDKIQLSGVTYDIGGQGGSGVSVVEVTQVEYDALPTSAKTDTSKMYVITDAEAGDLTNYYTKTETNTLLGGKADTATTYTKTEVDNAITAATSTKQDTLVSSVNIKTINNTSILGSGNIDIQGGGGGGKAVTGGTNISVTTGETADTINCTLPISYGGIWGHSINLGRSDNKLTSGDYNLVQGVGTEVKNNREMSCCSWNVSHEANNTFGDSGNTLFSVGNGTADNARHNAFEIRQNGDIYLTSGGTDIKLQDHLGGGGGGGITSGEVQTMIDESISGKTNKNDNLFTIRTNVIETVVVASGAKLRIIFAFDIIQNNQIVLSTDTVNDKSSLLSALATLGFDNKIYDIQGINYSEDTSLTSYFGEFLGHKCYAVLLGYVPDFGSITIGLKRNNVYYTLDAVDGGKYNYNYLSNKPSVTSAITSDSTDIVTSGGVYDQLGGLKLVKLTQAQYDALSPNYDSNTLYVIVN